LELRRPANLQDLPAASQKQWPPAAAALASARENRRLMQKGVVVDLLNEEIRHVGARDEPASPTVEMIRYAEVRIRPPHGALQRMSLEQDRARHDL